MTHVTQIFFSLVKAGLFGRTDSANFTDNVDWSEVYQLAEEQSVIGLMADGIDRFKSQVLGFKIPQEWSLQFVGATLQLEQRNKAMNGFIAQMVGEMRRAGIYTLLVKGQGVAQCYERPLWRSCGDVDLFLSEDNYQRAKDYLLPLGVETEPEEADKKHLAMQIGQWVVELHGTLHVGLSDRVDRMLDEVQEAFFYGGQVRSWMNGQTQVFLPDANEDVVYVFAHILQHFYKGGIGLRQICDWCRLLYTYKDSLNNGLLESRIRKAGLMSEWRAFYNLAHRYLGMPDFGSGLMVYDSRFDKKADRIMEFVLESGNFGHNRDMSYYGKYPYVIRKAFSMLRRIGDFVNHARIFPVNSVRFFFGIMYNGIRSAINGE